MAHNTEKSTSNQNQTAPPNWIRFVAGGAASCTAEIATIPIDTVKVRLQLQGIQGLAHEATASVAAATAGVSATNAATSAPVKLNMFQTIGSIVKNEGVAGLYKGLSPALLRQASYSSIRVGIYDPIRNFITGGSTDPTYGQKVLAGGTSGAIGIAIANPTELVKVRMQADKTGTRYKGTIDAFTNIVRHEGVTGLWQGVLPNVQRAFIVNAMELGTYDHAKTILVRDMNMDPTSVATHGAASFVAGFFATVGCNPVDVIKNRLMSQKTGEAKLYTGMIDCAMKTIKAEGPMALYKGFFPQWLRLAPWCMVMFISMEQYKSMLNARYAQ